MPVHRIIDSHESEGVGSIAQTAERGPERAVSVTSLMRVVQFSALLGLLSTLVEGQSSPAGVRPISGGDGHRISALVGILGVTFILAAGSLLWNLQAVLHAIHECIYGEDEKYAGSGDGETHEAVAVTMSPK